MGGGHRYSDISLTIAQRLSCTLHLENARVDRQEDARREGPPWVHLELPGLGLDDVRTVVGSWWCALFRVFPFFDFAVSGHAVGIFGRDAFQGR